MPIHGHRRKKLQDRLKSVVAGPAPQTIFDFRSRKALRLTFGQFCEAPFISSTPDFALPQQKVLRLAVNPCLSASLQKSRPVSTMSENTTLKATARTRIQSRLLLFRAAV